MKISNTEVRLGNFVYYQDKLSRVGTNDILIIGIKNNDFRAVDFTSDWLTMFGFKESQVKDHWWYEEETDETVIIMTIRIVRGKFYFVVRTSSDEDYETVSEITTVHQFQNLYFSLNNQEIIIKEEIL